MKDYSHFISSIESLAKKRKYMRVKSIGKSGKYKLYSVSLKGKGKRVLLSTGIHGDEPAGPKAIIDFLRNFDSSLLERFDFTILPCTNPYGYEHATRTNAERLDINRSFDDGSTKEAKIIRKFLKGKRFDLFIDVHEDWEYKGFYLYEHGNKKFGKKVISTVRKMMAIHSGKVDGFISNKGVICPNEKTSHLGQKPLTPYVHKRHSRHSLNFETPSTLKFKRRVKAHLVALNAALKISEKE